MRLRALPGSGINPKDLTFIGGFQNFIYSYNRDDLKYILCFTPSTLRSLEGLAAEIKSFGIFREIGCQFQTRFLRLLGRILNLFKEMRLISS